ncbi:Glycosyltransferase Gtf1 [compost metagenome]
MLDILIFSSFYLPGFKGGGPIRTISNMVEKLGDEIQFSVVTKDRDLGEGKPYAAISPNQWQRVGKAKIFYATTNAMWPFALWRVVAEFKGDALHLNSFFSFNFGILPFFYWKLMGRGRPIVLGPRGEFSEGALKLKASKKKLFLGLVGLLNIYKNVIWHASSEHEERDIRRLMGAKADVRIAMDIACPPNELNFEHRLDGMPLRIVFLSRISPMKNLQGAIEMMKKVSGSVIFDVYGPIEDAEYWHSCKAAIKELPINVKFGYKGELVPTMVVQTLARYDLFFLPTLGENFGHVIAEALGCGLPVLISDNTPWGNLAENQLGWGLPLRNVDDFVEKIEQCGRIAAVDYENWRCQIHFWAKENIGNTDAIAQSRSLFEELI